MGYFIHMVKIMGKLGQTARVTSTAHYAAKLSGLSYLNYIYLFAAHDAGPLAPRIRVSFDLYSP